MDRRGGIDLDLGRRSGYLLSLMFAADAPASQRVSPRRSKDTA